MSQNIQESANSLSRRGRVSDSIPFDLVIDILSRLPANSIARFRCVSKLWSDMLHRPDFTELFLTRSRARPRLFIAIKRYSDAPKSYSNPEWNFYSSPQTQNPGHELVHTRFYMKFPHDMRPKFRCLTSGLLLFFNINILRNREDIAPVVFNTNTGHYAILPKVSSKYAKSDSLLAFDPIDKEFKVLLIGNENYKILTLGTGELKWRTIQSPLSHHPIYGGTCINGVLYYIAYNESDDDSVIVCFDLRSETFKFIANDTDFFKLIDYKGKLCGIIWDFKVVGGMKFSTWVLEDMEKQVWSSEHVSTLWYEDRLTNLESNVTVAGMTSTGEIVISKGLYVFYFNPEKNTLRSVDLQGLGGDEFGKPRVNVFVDHVEDINVNDAKKLGLRPADEGLNIIRERS